MTMSPDVVIASVSARLCSAAKRLRIVSCLWLELPRAELVLPGWVLQPELPA